MGKVDRLTFRVEHFDALFWVLVPYRVEPFAVLFWVLGNALANT